VYDSTDFPPQNLQPPSIPPPPPSDLGIMPEMMADMEQQSAVDAMMSESPAPERPQQNVVLDGGHMAMLPGISLASMTRQPSTSTANNTDPNAPLRRIRRRDFCITYYGSAMKETVVRMATTFKALIAYCIFQHEICPNTGRPHWQVYIEFFNPQDISFVKHQLFCDTGTHVEIRLRSREDARAYCRKERTRMLGPQNEVGPFEFGQWREQGTGQKMHQLREAIADGCEVDNLAEDDPSLVLRNRVNLEWYSDKVHMRDAMKQNRTVTVRLFVGPTGSGKTHLAQQEALYYTRGDLGKVYFLDSGGKDAVWFDGYRYGPTLIIDDYNSWIQVAFLLRLMDKYPCRLPVKGSVKWAKYTEVWITSNKPLQQWTDSDGQLIDPRHMEALYRRIDWILYIPERGKFSVLKSPHPPLRMDLPTVEPLPPSSSTVPPNTSNSDASVSEITYVLSLPPSDEMVSISTEALLQPTPSESEEPSTSVAIAE